MDFVAEPSSQERTSQFVPSRNPAMDVAFTRLTQVMAGAIALLLFSIVIVVGIRAWPAIQTFGLSFVTDSIWDPTRSQYGILPAIVGTLVSALIGLGLAIPIGVGTAIFLSEDFLPPPVQTVLVSLVELLAAIPSVVYGLWGVFVLIPLVKPAEMWLYTHAGWIPFFSTPPAGPGLLPASLILTVMVLPIVIAISRNTLVALPADLRQAAFAVGATRSETLFGVLLLAAFSGIVGGIMLALGRAMGETMAVTLIIGNANQISASLFAPASTISSLLANQFAEASGLQVSALMYAALILFGLTLMVNIAAEMIVRRVKQGS